jgi:hypothetical protein
MRFYSDDHHHNNKAFLIYSIRFTRLRALCGYKRVRATYGRFDPLTKRRPAKGNILPA